MKTFALLCAVLFWGILESDFREVETGVAFELQASTPGDSAIKNMLNIDQAFPVDFIRWRLLIKPENQTFDLDISYGLSQPNTLGFTADGQKKSVQGSYQVHNSSRGEVYQLKSAAAKVELSLLQFNEDLYHVLDAKGQLLLGNGGWSYSLNRKNATKVKAALPVLVTAATLSKSTRHVVVFDGRTPCSELAQDYKIPVSNDCFKLKWRLTLYRDSITLKPSTYTLTRINRRANAIQGTWKIVQKGESVIYQLHPTNKEDEALQFLVGDENVLFFLDKTQRLLVGDENFSFALNRKLK